MEYCFLSSLETGGLCVLRKIIIGLKSLYPTIKQQYVWNCSEKKQEASSSLLDLIKISVKINVEVTVSVVTHSKQEERDSTFIHHRWSYPVMSRKTFQPCISDDKLARILRKVLVVLVDYSALRI